MRPAPAGDAELLTAVAAGDPDAVRRLLDDVAPVVYGYIFARVGAAQPAAEDLLQETLLEAVRSAPGYRAEASLTTWLCAIARRRLARHYEAERRAEAARVGLRLVRDGAPSPDGAVEDKDEIARAMGRLSPLHRQVLTLKYLDDRSVADMARELDRTPVQIQSLLARARHALRRELGDAGD